MCRALAVLAVLAVACQSPSAAPDAALTSDAAPTADAPPASPTVVTIDLGAAQFPALTRKLGFNSDWNALDPADLAAIATGGAAGAPMVSGLVETKYGPGDAAGSNAVMAGGPLIYRDGSHALQTRASAPLTTLRQAVGAQGMLNFVQLAGTPCASTAAACQAQTDQTIFQIDPAAQDTGSGNGNWYPLAAPAQVSAEAAAFAALTGTLAADGTPTIWALWQEPDHTLDGNPQVSKKRAVDQYLGLYRPFATAVRAADPDAMIAGPQQNQATGTNANGVIDGAGYVNFVTNGGDGVGQGAPVPLDFVTIQDYLATASTLEVIENARVAYGDARFARAPVMFNEWDYDKTQSVSAVYGTSAGMIAVLDQMALILDQPDVAYVLLKRALYDANAALLAQIPLQFLATLSPHRRPLAVTGVAAAQLAGLASGDADGLGMLLWNHDTSAQVLDVTLHAIPPALVAAGAHAQVATLGTGAPQVIQDVALDAADVTLRAITVPPQGCVLLHAGAAPAQSTALTRARYARHVSWVPRLGGTSSAAPHGAGQYDVRSGTLVASVDGALGVGLAGVVLRGVPATYALHLAVASSGLAASDTGAALAVRVDYLVGGDSVGAVVYRDPRFTGALPSASLVAGAAPTPTVTPLGLADGAVDLPITAAAPPGWDSARRVMISLLVAAPPGAATVTARLSDGP